MPPRGAFLTMNGVSFSGRPRVSVAETLPPPPLLYFPWILFPPVAALKYLSLKQLNPKP